MVTLPISGSDKDSDSRQKTVEDAAQEPVPSSGGSAEPVTVPLGALVTGGSPRVSGVNLDHVRLLADLEERLPPVLVHRATMRVVDGEHRLHAARLNGAESIQVEFFDGSERECLVHAIERNVRNGLPLTLQDRREAARRVIELYPDWSDRRIAKTVGLSKNTVASVRERMDGSDAPRTIRIGVDGRARPLSAIDGRIRAGEVLSQRPDASLREIAEAAGISVGTARDVRERIHQGLDPLPDGRPVGSGAAARVPARALPEITDLGRMLDSLRRDPALKYTDEGRALLRWLDSRLVRPEEVGLADRVPPHRAAAVARVARACASRWEDIAACLEQLATSTDPSGERPQSQTARLTNLSAVAVS